MNVSQMILYEWRAIWKDKRILAVLLIIPVAYMLIFGSMYGQGQIQNLATVYVDESNTPLSQQIIQAFDTSHSFSIEGRLFSEEELVKQIERGQAVVGLIIPKDLTDKIMQDKHSEIMTIIDGSNIMISNAAIRNANEIIQTFSAGISAKRLEAKGIELNQAHSIQYAYRIFYNPGFSYGIFMLIGLLGAVIQQVLFLGISLAVTREKETDRWVEYLEHWQQPWKIIYAKFVPYFLIGIFNLLFNIGVLQFLFKIPVLGSTALLIVLSLAFVLSLLGIGFLASLTAKTQLQATQITMLIAMPSFLLSGFTWPFDAMPTWVAYLGHALPLTYFLNGLRELAIKGNGWEMISADVYILFFMASLSILLSLFLLHVQGKKEYS